MQIHGSSDASMKAYGACVYLRTIYDNGSVSNNITCSKSRVAPLTVISLPRLELCGALLLAKLVKKVGAILALVDKSVHF